LQQRLATLVKYITKNWNLLIKGIKKYEKNKILSINDSQTQILPDSITR
jgi:hypothetical protein